MTIVRGKTGNRENRQEQATTKQEAPRYHLDLMLYPQRSLKPEHFSKILLVLIIICTLASIRFLIAGAWPVVLFLGLDVVALWFAFFLSYRRGRVFETIQLSEKDLIIGKSDVNGRVTTTRFEPYWATVAIKTVGADKNILTVSHHDQSVELGSFLVPHERREIAEELKRALERWKNC